MLQQGTAGLLSWEDAEAARIAAFMSTHERAIIEVAADVLSGKSDPVAPVAAASLPLAAPHVLTAVGCPFGAFSANRAARRRRFRRPGSRGPRRELLLYLGCNVLRTAHLVKTGVAVLEAMGFDFNAAGGPAHCCGMAHH